MEAGSTPPAPQQSTGRGLLWGLIAAVVVLGAIGVGAVLYLWPDAEERVAVPDVVGLERVEAEDAVAAAGLVLGEIDRITVDADSAEVDRVLSQLPRAGDQIEPDSEVALVLAEAPEDSAEGDGETLPGGPAADPQQAAEGTLGRVAVQGRAMEPGATSPSSQERREPMPGAR
jgi:beta-lactam-binding protein with PASTA domain